MADLTGTSAIITFTVANLFLSPQRLQGFAADDIYDTDPLEVVETIMGADGKLSGGFVWKEVKQSFKLQADSPSNLIFEQWAAAQTAGLTTLPCNGRTTIISTGRAYIMTNGFMTTFSPFPSVGKLLKPRTHTITWNQVVAVPN